ncbi:MAG: dihydroorotase [Thermoleophilia bacterium]
MNVSVPPTVPRLVCRSRPHEHFVLNDVHLFDPATALDRRGSLEVRDGLIAALGPVVSPGEPDTPGGETSPDDPRLMAGFEGCHVFPGFVDMHAHLRTPGQEYKEDLVSAAEAALAGGFVLLVGMANTVPAVDTGPLATWILDEAERSADVMVGQVGALSRGLDGVELAELRELATAGVAAFSDDGRPVHDLDLLRTALRYLRATGRPVLLHLEDPTLSVDGVVHEGAWSARLGLRGIPAAAETGPMARDLELLRDLASEPGGAPRLHFQHLSTAGAVRLLREARADGLPVTAEVTPHHLLLGDDKLQSFDQSLKINPPLRTAADRATLTAALDDGTVDCVATDHAPHAPHEKEVPFEDAPFGTVGLETAFAALYGGLVRSDGLSLARLVDALSGAPCRCLGLEPPRLEVGAAANLCVVDLREEWTVGSADLRGKSRNSAFLGERVSGRVVLTVVRGVKRFQRDRA